MPRSLQPIAVTVLLAAACAGRARPSTTPLPTVAASPADAAYDGQLAVRRWGREGAPPLVLIHGLGDAAGNDFATVGPLLARDHRVHAIDLPGFGASRGAGHSFHPGDYAELVAEYIAHHTEGRASVVGHSMGGAVAALLAGRHPERVDRLVLVDVAGVLHREAWAGSMAIEPVRAHNGTIAGMMESTLGVSRSFEPDLEEVVAHPRLRRGLLGDDPGRVSGISLITTDLGEALDGIAAPTLLVWGAEDRVAPLRTSRVLEGRIVGSRRVVMEGVGHVPMSDDPGRFVSHVRGHLNAEAAVTRDVESRKREIRCEDEEGLTLTGRLGRVELYGCRRVHIADATIDSLVVHDSDVVLEAVSIASPGTAVEAENAELRITGGSITGDVAFELSHARLDMAGVRVDGSRAAFLIGEPSRALFSVCPVRSGDQTIHAHGAVVLAAE